VSEFNKSSPDSNLPESLEDFVHDMRADVLSDESLDRVTDRLAPILGGAGAAGAGAAAGAATATGATGAAVAGTGTLSGLVTVKWVGVAVVLLAAAGGSTYLLRGSDDRAAPIKPDARAAPARIPQSVVEPEPDPAILPRDEGLVPAAVAPPPESVRRRRALHRRRPVPEAEPEPPEPGAVSSAVVLEHRQLREARRVLARDPAKALSLVREHERSFPHGALRPEREVIAIEALARLGRTDSARARAARFVERWPSSPYRHQVESALR
jgi:hypothetical protein